MLATSNEQLVVDFLAAMGRADIDALSEMLADDASWWLAGDLPVAGLYRGKAGSSASSCGRRRHCSNQAH